MSGQTPEDDALCANCGETVWRPGVTLIHWATGRVSCANICADARVTLPAKTEGD